MTTKTLLHLLAFVVFGTPIGGSLLQVTYLGEEVPPGGWTPLSRIRLLRGSTLTRVYYRAKCDLEDYAGCDALLEQYAEMRHRPTSAGYQPLCSSGHQRACERVGESYLEGRRDGDFSRGFALLEAACGSGRASACMRAGTLLSRGDSGIRADSKRARTVFKQACDLGDEVGCRRYESIAPHVCPGSQCITAPLGSDISQWLRKVH